MGALLFTFDVWPVISYYIYNNKRTSYKVQENTTIGNSYPHTHTYTNTYKND